MARPVRLLLFQGPGEVDRLRAAFIGRQWSLLINLSEADTLEAWPSLTETWRKRQVFSVYLTAPERGRTDPDELDTDHVIQTTDVEIRVIADELRPGRRSVIVETPQLVVGVGVSPGVEPPAGKPRSLLIDASWTHVNSFPDREQVRSAIAHALDTGTGRIYFVTDLEWDAALFEVIAGESRSRAAIPLVVRGSTTRKLWQARQTLSEVQPVDTVLIGLVPGRDERGLFQRLRSDFAERTSHVRAFPSIPLSTGPGLSRDEALEVVGLWLPTNALVAAGPISEQVLLARHLEESTGGSLVTPAVAGGEYRLPEFEIIRHNDVARRADGPTRLRGAASRAGLVLVAFGHDEDGVTLAGTGLPEAVESILPKIRVARRGKTAEQIVREVETAFSSRGLPVPAVRFLG